MLSKVSSAAGVRPYEETDSNNEATKTSAKKNEPNAEADFDNIPKLAGKTVEKFDRRRQKENTDPIKEQVEEKADTK